MRTFLLGLVFLIAFSSAHAAMSPIPPSGDASLCQAAISKVEPSTKIPAKLLTAIARTESGRSLPTGQVVAWPWTINVAGVGYFFESVQDAIVAVENFRAANVRSIDVGCMQVNLMHHPNAFASLQQAFEPSANAAYAAKFLTSLYAELGNWPKAIAAYHSRVPELSTAYGQRVMQAWPLARLYGEVAAPTRRTQLAMVDPYRVYTPEFARLLASDATARTLRDRRK